VFKCNTAAQQASWEKCQRKFGTKYPTPTIPCKVTSGKISNDGVWCEIKTKLCLNSREKAKHWCMDIPISPGKACTKWLLKLGCQNHKEHKETRLKNIASNTVRSTQQLLALELGNKKLVLQYSNNWYSMDFLTQNSCFSNGRHDLYEAGI
jgi:hypothetical protein